MGNYITKIKINKVFHLENLEIPISETEKKHLIITGKNGSGKTVLINAIAKYIQDVTDEVIDLLYTRVPSIVRGNLSSFDFEKETNLRIKQYLSESGEIEVIYHIPSVYQSYINNDFFFAFYGAYRKPQIIEPTNATKPLLRVTPIKETITDQFLYFLSDLKIQEALARNERMIEEANHIKQWFDGFEQLLRDIFSDQSLSLVFNFKDYSFTIYSEGKSFKLVELSDGYAAIIEVVADLILKMQGSGSVSGNYDKAGIVLIDEIETHLHLELQRVVLPLLTQVFPNIQFIVTTHSPFVLNSLPDAVAYDLEQRESIGNLTDYSYEALAEGYFGVSTESSYLRMRLSRYKSLCEQPTLNPSELIEKETLYSAFNAIPSAVAPAIIAEFKQITLKQL